LIIEKFKEMQFPFLGQYYDQIESQDKVEVCHLYNARPAPFTTLYSQ